MKRVTLVVFGKIKTPGLVDTSLEFEKRISKYVEWQVVELKPETVQEKSEQTRTKIQSKEYEKLRETLDSPTFKQRTGKNAAIWCLDETGKPLRTLDWAERFKVISTQQSGDLVLIIGGGLGLDRRILSEVQLAVSLGPQTLSHDLARVVATEQVYRVLSLLSGHPYHNEG